MKKLNVLFLTIAFLATLSSVNAQSNREQMLMESVLSSKKWTCLEVSRKKLAKEGFKFEVGNDLSLSIDKKFSYKNNEHNYVSGTWKVDGKYMYFIFDSQQHNGNTIVKKYRVLTIDKNELKLKRLDKPRAKLTFK